jgi:hypothetical protein
MCKIGGPHGETRNYAVLLWRSYCHESGKDEVLSLQLNYYSHVHRLDATQSSLPEHLARDQVVEKCN